MRRLIASTALVAALVGPALASAPYPVNLQHRISTINSSGYVARDTITLYGASQSIDTTMAYEAKWVDWAEASGGRFLEPFAFGQLTAWTASKDAVNVDTLFVATDFGPTSTGPWVPGEFLPMPAADFGINVFSLPLIASGSAFNSPFLAGWFRWRVRADGDDGSAFPAMRLVWTYLRTD